MPDQSKSDKLSQNEVFIPSQYQKIQSIWPQNSHNVGLEFKNTDNYMIRLALTERNALELATAIIDFYTRFLKP